MALRAILDQPQPVYPRDVGESRQLCGLPIDVHGQDSGRPAARRLLQDPTKLARSHRVGTGLYIDQDWGRAGALNRGYAGDSSMGHGEDQIPRADTAGAQCDLDGIRPAADPAGVRHPDELCKGGLESLDFAAENIGAAFENAGYGGIDCGTLREIPGSRVRLRDGKHRSIDRHMRSDVAREIAAVIVERTAQALGYTDTWAPAGQSPKMVIVDQEVAHVDALALRRKLPNLEITAAIRFDHRSRQVGQADRVAAAHIERQPLGHGREPGVKESIHSVIDIEEIAPLLAAPHYEALALDDPPQPNAEKGLAGILDAHSGPEDVGQPQRACPDAVD